MIEKNIYLYGLTNVQRRIIISHIPQGFHYRNIREDDIMTDEAIEKIVSKSWVSFINPRKLSVEELGRIIEAHRYAKHHSHASMLEFTEWFTREQKKSGITKGYSEDNIRHNWANWRFPMGMFEAFEPYWNNIEAIRGRLFGDDWYLLSLETTGKDVLEDDILSITIKHMTRYRICSTEILYIKQDRPISESVTKYTCITNEMCEAGITREEAAAYLNGLSAPVIVGNDSIDVPFLRLLYRLCGRQFDLPVLGMRALLALVLNDLGGNYEMRSPLLSDFFRDNGGFSFNIMPRRYERSAFDSLLVEVVLSVFEQLETRYNVHGIDDILAFYAFYDRSSEYDEYDLFGGCDDNDNKDEDE